MFTSCLDLELCEYADYQGDGYCDDENNHEECGYDGGDCCDNDYDFAFDYCYECQCLDPNNEGESENSKMKYN